MWTPWVLPALLGAACADILPLSVLFDQIPIGTPFQDPLCNQVAPVTAKRGQQFPPNAPVCPLTVDSLWFMCVAVPFEMAADVCASYGWRLAMLSRDNAQAVSDVMNNCTGLGGAAWMAGGLGLPADPCAIAVGNGESVTMFQDVGDELCRAIDIAVICEEMPQQTIITTETAYNFTIPFGQTTTTTTSISTRTARPFHPQCSRRPEKSSDTSSGETYYGSSDSSLLTYHGSSSSSSSSHDRHWRRKTPKQRFHKAAFLQQFNTEKVHNGGSEPYCYFSDCLPACNYTSPGGIHMITGLANYTDAADECAKYGWSLLDFTSGRASDVIDLVQECTGSVLSEGHINSYNGIFAPCPFLLTTIEPQIVFPVAAVGLLADPQWCDQLGTLNIFCQDQCPFAVVEDGAEPGEVSLTITTTTTTMTFYPPSTTIVVSESCKETVHVQK